MVAPFKSKLPKTIYWKEVWTLQTWVGYIGIEKCGKWSKSKMKMNLYVQNATVDLRQRQVQNIT